ncbi:hypothetical protein [Kibdelosporangium philippinense]|uniref:hypothetical protein n=1 Tax=Kibdelosporangium philippinense TaxID=211113 RepID=UPI0036215645
MRVRRNIPRTQLVDGANLILSGPHPILGQQDVVLRAKPSVLRSSLDNAEPKQPRDVVRNKIRQHHPRRPPDGEAFRSTIRCGPPKVDRPAT